MFESLAAQVPTAANTSNQLANAGNGLENLINLGVGAYSAVNRAKLEKQYGQTQLQEQRLNPTTNTTTAGGFSPAMLIGGVAAAGLVLFLVLKK